MLFMTSLGVSVPGFILATLLQYSLSYKLSLFPIASWGSWSHTILPVIALAVLPTAFIARMIRANMLEVLQQEYIKAAKARGISKYRLYCAHALRNALLPVITYTGPLCVGLAAALIDLVIGIFWGGIAALMGGWVDEIMMRIADILYALPYLLVVTVLLVIIGPSLITIILAMTIIGWITMARIVRGQILWLKTRWFCVLFFLVIASQSFAQSDLFTDRSFATTKSLGSQSKTIDLAICAIFQNEDRFLKEWIEYHRLIGVQKFYLYANHNTDNFFEVLQPYVQRKIVKLIDWNQPGFRQMEAYSNATQRAIKEQVKWLAVIDTDEFIVPSKR
jgi:hypothetical protein